MLPLEEKFCLLNPLARWSKHSILVAVSGGADSVALLRVLHHFRPSVGLKLVVAHANHQLRGEESDEDELFVSELCKRLEIPFIHERLMIARTSCGLEADARRARYEFLENAAARSGCRYLALAHHREDQVETILHRILRGTGVSGLSGMAASRSLQEWLTLIRPLLSFSRSEMVEYLNSLNQCWRTDSSNSSMKMTRNRLRRSLLPQLRNEYNADLDEALLRLGTVAESMQSFVDQEVERLAKTHVRKYSDGFRVFPCAENERFHQKKEFSAPEVHPFLWSELFRWLWRQADLPQREMGLSEWELLVQMLLASPNAPKAHDFPGKIAVLREAEALFIMTPF